jgi:hypothetical protein
MTDGAIVEKRKYQLEDEEAIEEMLMLQILDSMD